MQTLYIDVLFFINFFMDGLALLLTGGILHFPRKALRVACAATLGAAYAVADVLFPGHPAVSAAIGIALSVLLVRIAFPEKNPRRFLSGCLVFYAVSVFLGGAVTVFYSLLRRLLGAASSLPPTRSDVILTLAGLSGVLVALATRFFRRRSVGKTRELSLAIGGKGSERKIALSALVDSGNLLSDPLSGKPVILLGRAGSRRLFPSGIPTPDAALRTFRGGKTPLDSTDGILFRPVFVESATGREMLWAFVPQGLFLSEKTGESPLSAVIALDEHTEKFGDCDALLPTSLLL